jgi:hypothetical protein
MYCLHTDVKGSEESTRAHIFFFKKFSKKFKTKNVKKFAYRAIVNTPRTLWYSRVFIKVYLLFSWFLFWKKKINGV